MKKISLIIAAALLAASLFTSCGNKKASEMMNEFMQKEINSKKIGLFCVNDLYAVKAINAAHRNNVKIPDQLSIVGFDNTMVCNMTFPALTTVKQPLDEIAAKSFELLCKKMNQKDDVQTIEKIVLHASLAKRES